MATPATSMNPFFNVSRNPIFTKINGSEFRLPKDVLVNNDTNLPVGIVSPGFQIVENSEVNDCFMDAFSQYKVADTMDFLKKGGEIWTRRIIFEDDELTFEVREGDTSHVMLEIFNGFNTTTRMGYKVSLFRSICRNGMVFGRKDLFGASFTHAKNNVDRIKSGFALGTSHISQNVIPTWKKWTEISHTMEDMGKYLDSLDYVNTDKMKERILVKYEEVMNKEGHDETRFGAFNAITEIMTHETSHRREDTSNIFSRSYAIYEKIAQDMYELPM